MVSGLFELVRQSILFDLRIARLDIPQSRVLFLVRKYCALGLIAAGRSPQIRIGGQAFEVDSVSTIGTLQSCITDVASEIVATEVLGPLPRIIDIGANVGQFCAAIKLFYPEAQVLSIEADPHTYDRLLRNTSKIPGVSTRCLAIGNVNETRRFYRHPLSGMSSFVPYPDQFYPEESIVDLEVKRLDDLSAFATNRIDLLKIDVEGFEAAVLQGGVETLTRVHYLLCEIGLGRQVLETTNLALMSWIHRDFPDARIVTTGRQLGRPGAPVCQDILFNLRPEWGC